MEAQNANHGFKNVGGHQHEVDDKEYLTLRLTGS